MKRKQQPIYYNDILIVPLAPGSILLPLPTEQDNRYPHCRGLIYTNYSSFWFAHATFDTVFSILKYALIPPKRPERIVSGVPPEETGLLVLVQ